MLRSDTTTLFERLREANILLQEVLSGAHENMSAIENTLVTRVSEFVATMNEVSERSGVTTSQVDQHISAFHSITNKALTDLGQLATSFDTHGRSLAEAVALIDKSNRHADAAIGERRAGIETLVGTLDARTDDIEQRLKRFSSLLDESLDGATGRAREIARIVADFERRRRPCAGTGTRARQRAAARHLHAAHQRDARDVLADHAALRRDAPGHAADGCRDAARARGHAHRAAPRHPRTAAGDRRKRLPDAPRHRRSDRGAGRAQPHRRPPRSRPRRVEPQVRRAPEPAYAGAGGRAEGSAHGRPPPRHGTAATADAAARRHHRRADADAAAPPRRIAVAHPRSGSRQRQAAAGSPSCCIAPPSPTTSPANARRATRWSRSTRSPSTSRG